MKKTNLPSLVTISILTAITIILWIFFSVYRVLTAKPAPSVAPGILEPVSPTLERGALDKIETSLFFEESQIPTTIVSSPIPTLAPSPTPAPEETPTATPTASPTGTP